MDSKAIRGNLLLVLTSLIWGVAFVSQRIGLDHLGSFSFNGLRTLLGAASVLPVVLIGRRRNPPANAGKGAVWIGGVACGIVLCVATNLQQLGLMDTSVGKAGFITALYILFVPLAGLLMGKKVTRLFVAAVGVALFGMFLLTWKGGEPASRGDMLVLASAVIFAGHIMVIDHFSPRVDGAMMAMVQFLVSGALSLVIAGLVGERIELSAVRGALMPILYSGVMSCGVGYTLQIVAQKDVNPVVASLLMSLESVFAMLAGWLLLGQSLTARELFGCGLVFVAIILAQLPQKQKVS